MTTVMPNVTNESLMARYQAHLDAEAFEQLVSRFWAPAVTVAQEILFDSALAEDAVQETFLRIVRKRHSYRASMPFSNWFYAILRNVCTDMLRRRVREKRLLDEFAHHKAKQARGVAGDSADVTEALARLPKMSRAVLTLRIVHGLPFREVAAALGTSEEAAKKRAQRALRRLREMSCVARCPQGRSPLQPSGDQNQEEADDFLEKDVPAGAS